MREFDSKVPYNYNEKKMRPFIGILLEINDIKYFAPLSSPKEKYLKMKSKLDFLRIDGGKLGAINFNNMIPVKDYNIIKLDLDNDVFNDSERKYIKLLKEQIYWLNRNNEKLYSRAILLYDSYNEGILDEKIADRCCNFKLLEEKCELYDGNNVEVNV